VTTKDWPDDKRAVRASIRRETGRWASRSRGNRVASSAGQKRARVNEKESDKMDGGGSWRSIQGKKSSGRRRRGGARGREDNSPSTPKFFREVRGVGHYRGSHTSFTSLPLLCRAHVNHNALECPSGETFVLRTSRVKNLSALKLIRQRARSQVRFECL